MTFPFESETPWRSVVASSPQLVLLLDRQARVRFHNQLDFGDAVQPSIYDLLVPEVHDQVRDWIRRVLSEGKSADFKAEYELAAGVRTLCITSVRPLHDGQGKVAGVIVWLQDISEVRDARRELAQQKNILSAIIDSLADGVAVVDAQGRFLVYNQAAERLVGVNPQDVRPEDWSRHFGLYLPDRVRLYDVEDLPLRRAAAGEQAREVEVYVKNAGQPDGAVLSVNATPLVDEQGRHQGGVAVFRDVTAQKQAEEKLRSEERLLRKLLDLQESDRRMISHEIHDGFVQDVVGANMRLEAAKSRVPEGLKELAEPLEQASLLLRKAITEARRLIGDLSPLVIDERGVMEALRHLVADQETHRGLKVRFTADDDIPLMDERLEGAIFRIVQEALNNVSHHARTDRAELEIRHRDGWLTIHIRDRGVGFDPATVSPERFGVRGIRERARLFGGRAGVESTPDEGTTVRVELPVKPSLDT